MIHAYAALHAATPLQPYDYPTPRLGPYDVQIDIDYCGLCYSDVHLIDNDWGISKYPLIPGHEIVGRIRNKGSSPFEVGQCVGVGWQSGACLTCEFCRQGDETVCPNKIRTCVDRWGGFANQIVVDSRFVVPIPQELDPASAAPLLCGGVTTYSPFRIYQVKPSQKVAIIGIGGLGHLALQFAHALGCNVTAISHSPDKEAEARTFGADHFLTYEQLGKAASRFDFILSTVHADLDWGSIGLLLRPYGKLCFVGLPNNPIQFPARLLISGNRSLCGSGTGSRALLRETLAFAAQHHITPQIELFPISELNSAITRLKENKARYRIVIQGISTKKV